MLIHLFDYLFLFPCRMFSYGEFKAEDQVTRPLCFGPAELHSDNFLYTLYCRISRQRELIIEGFL